MMAAMAMRLSLSKQLAAWKLPHVIGNAVRAYATSEPILPKVGQTFETEELFDRDRVAQFVSVTGDANILHTDPDDEGSEVQGKARLGGAIIPGSLCASLFPAIIGSAFPGALYLSQTLKFRNPALVGSTVRAEVTVERVSGSRIAFDTVCRLAAPPPTPLLDSSGAGLTLVDGKALALLQGWTPEPEDAADG